MIDGVVQEIDIPTGKVLFQWNSADHVPYSQSEQPLPASASTPWDWFHINAVHIDTDGNLLIDARNTWTTYKVNRAQRQHHLAARRQGQQLHAAGRARARSLNNAGEIFAWQHDPEALGHDVYTFFDNESAGVANTGSTHGRVRLSRAVTRQARRARRTRRRWSRPTTSRRA